MYGLGSLGQGSTGERFRIISSRKGGRVFCPSGTTQESGGVLGTGQKYVWCYRPPVFAPPPVTTTTISPVIRTSVPTAVSTQVSPQISPTLAQQQASPGAAVSAAPQAAPGPVTARPSTGITGEDLQRILEAQRLADKAERDAEERRRTSELETLRVEMAKRDRMSRDIALAESKARADRAEKDRFARDQAEAMAAQTAQVLPPPTSTTYAPSGGGAFPLPPSVVPSTLPEAFAPPPEAAIGPAPVKAGQPWALILLAAAGVGVLVLSGGKKSKRKARAKK